MTTLKPLPRHIPGGTVIFYARLPFLLPKSTSLSPVRRSLRDPRGAAAVRDQLPGDREVRGGAAQKPGAHRGLLAVMGPLAMGAFARACFWKRLGIEEAAMLPFAEMKMFFKC